jgi:hypothetical protein
MATNWANTPGPTPGPSSVVKNHKAMASGVVLPVPRREVDIHFGGKTGETEVPGFTHKSKKRR